MGGGGWSQMIAMDMSPATTYRIVTRKTSGKMMSTLVHITIWLAIFVIYIDLIGLQSTLLKMNFREPAKFILIIRSSSYQDIVIHVQYYSKPNRAWKP